MFVGYRASGLVRFSWGEYGGSWVTFAWRMALSMVRDSVRGLPCQIVSCASLEGEYCGSWAASRCGVLRSASLRVSVRGLSCWSAVARGFSTGAVLGLVVTCPLLCGSADARGVSTQVQLLDIVDMPAVVNDSCPMVQTVQKTVVVYAQLQYI